MIVRPPGLPVTMNRRPSFARIVGVMLESIRRPGRARFASGPDQAVRVVSPGPALKSPSRCSAGTRAGHDDLRAVAVLERVGQGDGVAIGVHDDRCVVSSLSAGHSNRSGDDTPARSARMPLRRDAA